MPQTAYDLSETGATCPKYAMTLLTVEEFQRFWSGIEEMLDLVPHTWRRWTKEHIYQAVTSDLMQVWGIGPPPKATLIVITTISVYPTMRVLCTLWAGGTFEEAMVPVMDAAFTNYAKLNGCAELEVRGRPGWEPHMKTTGFTREALVWTRSVPNVTIN